MIVRKITTRFVAFLLAFTLCFAGTTLVFAEEIKNEETGYRAILRDEADFLSSSEEQEILDVMSDITAYGNVMFITTTDHVYSSSEDLAVASYESEFGNDANGVCFVIDRKLNNIYLITEGQATRKVIGNKKCETITDNTYVHATASHGYDYGTCALETFQQVYSLLEGNRIKQPMKWIGNAFIAIILAFLLNYFLAMFLSRSTKASDSQILSNIYNHFELHNAKAEFTHQTKTYSPQSSGSSGGGGGGGGGGGHSGGGHSI